MSSLSPARRADLLSFSLSFLLALASIFVGAFVGGRSYIVVSVIVVLCAIAPFFITFEQRRPQARELVLIAVLCALAVAARCAFVWVPHFKPMAAIVMIAGMACGGRSGFLVGAVAVLASNFMFGQGPWTPWQMLSFGSCGLVFGILCSRGVFSKCALSWAQRIALGIAGAAYVILIAGPILDTSSLFYMLSSITPSAALAVYLAGFPVNCMQAIAVGITLVLVSNPILNAIARIQSKYGMGQAGMRR